MLILNNQVNNTEPEENESVSKDDLNVSDWDDVDENEEEADEEAAEEAENDFHWSEICMD